MVNLTRQTISNFERGVSSPSLLDMKRISQALRVPLPDLLSPELIKPSVAA
ncbi:helix-turn-helix transcriptional regulator [Synechococcus sp. N5]|uniref:helix-turn-helix transcriptional regulator n=1 Tax=Synechococcus sp. N5 TaxID=2575515 RepID=UPI00352DED64